MVQFCSTPRTEREDDMSDALEIVQYAFMEAMRAGYAKSEPRDTIDDFPCSKVFSFDMGMYRVIDFYLANPDSDKSTGQTTVWLKGAPVWTMHYGGRYAKIAIPFLKECLTRAYVRERIFYGGRGPLFVRGERFTYVNRVARSSFADFEGEEHIFDLSENRVGNHWYRGMSLLKR